MGQSSRLNQSTYSWSTTGCLLLTLNGPNDHFQLNPEPLKFKMAALDTFWLNKSQCDEAERLYFEKLSGAKVILSFACLCF